MSSLLKLLNAGHQVFIYQPKTTASSLELDILAKQKKEIQSEKTIVVKTISSNFYSVKLK